jgi:hypothetical protein
LTDFVYLSLEFRPRTVIVLKTSTPTALDITTTMTILLLATRSHFTSVSRMHSGTGFLTWPCHFIPSVTKDLVGHPKRRLRHCYRRLISQRILLDDLRLKLAMVDRVNWPRLLGHQRHLLHHSYLLQAPSQNRPHFQQSGALWASMTGNNPPYLLQNLDSTLHLTRSGSASWSIKATKKICD